MALITRLSRLFKADMHAVLDRIEEPQQMLQQAVREMEEALHQERMQLKRLQNEQHGLLRRLHGLQQKMGQGEAELDVCFNSGKEELARSLIRRRLESERLVKLLTQQEEALGEQVRQLESRVEQHRGDLDGMRQKAELLASEQAVDQSEVNYGKAEDIGIHVTDDEVEVAFLCEKQRRAKL